MKKFEKNFEQISSHHWRDMSYASHKVRINRINIIRALLLLSIPKKVKEALRTRLSGNKISWTEPFIRSKKFAKWKTTLNRGALVCYENLPIKTHLKKRPLFFVCHRNLTPSPPPPAPPKKKTVASGVYTAFPQITQKILITDTCHLLEPITVILGFLKIFTFRHLDST